MESKNEAPCALGKTGRTCLQTATNFQELILIYSYTYILILILILSPILISLPI